MEITGRTAEELDESYENENLRKLEAVLFIAGRFLSLREIVGLTGINPIILRALIEKLAERYAKGDGAIEIIEKDDMWKMDVRQEYIGLVNQLATGNTEFTKAEQETLAIIAYKQPVKQSVIVKIRGNKAYEHVKKFVGIGLLRAKKIGHTNELSLSDEFHDYFSVGKSQAQAEETEKNDEKSGEKPEENKEP
ncbi:SMC-Scp complex subunit ScpB [Candidatus Pacearchaeota archaeon]|nr:SMC-Scp complex subunit ScpB [Candidatus Pacearchaeota archaeon]